MSLDCLESCRRRAIWLAAVLWAFCAVAAEEGGKSGVSPQVICLPDGPASIAGLGESFEPQLNTGTASYRVPLRLPALRGGAPELALEYNSGFGNGPVGMGWRLSVPYIQRQTDKGLPLYGSGDSFIEWGGEELVLVNSATGDYRCENEQGGAAFAKFHRNPDGSWRVHLRNGTILIFGDTENTRQDRASGQTFRWMLSSHEDSNGNRSVYSYLHDQGQIYLDEIRYGGHATEASSEFTVKCTYDQSGRPDPVVDYRGRFACTTRWRLSKVTVSDGPRRLREWQVGYGNGRHSLLTEVKVFGDQRATTGPTAQVNQDFLPPLKFGYTDELKKAGPEMVSVSGAPLVSFRIGEAELVDINADGLPDILLDDQGTYKSALNRGPGKTWGSLATFNFSPSARLSAATTKLADLNGNGRSKLLLEDSDGLYYLPFVTPVTFGTDVNFQVPGSFPIADPDVRFVDINNDKAIDMMATDPGSFSFVINKNNGTENYFLPSPPAPPSSGIRFSQGWQFGDMNGDTLQDLVVLGPREEGGCAYHPNMGWGSFGSQVAMTGGPDDADLGYGGINRLYLSDVDQDGLADLVFVDSGVVKYWLNENGSRWGVVRQITSGIPNYDAGQVGVRFADMNGNGSTDIVWNRTDAGTQNALKYLELLPGEKPFQLNRIENGVGGATTIEYSTSTAYMVAAAGTPKEWTSVIPFPVDVVSAFEVSDGRGNTSRVEITYRNGYYNGLEREFRGFEETERREIGDATAPDQVLAYAYDTGAAKPVLKGRPKSVQAREVGGAVFYSEGYEWNGRVLLSGGGGDSRKVSFAEQKVRTRNVVEKGAAPIQLKWEYEYDAYGNLTRQLEHGRLDPDWNDERVTATTYTAAYPSGISTWILDNVVTREVTDENNVRAAHVRNYYDGSSTLGEVTKGNLTRVEGWVRGDEYIVTVRNDYDAFGNVIATYDPLSGVQPGHSRQFVYETEHHTFPIEERILVGDRTLTMSAAYDYGLGVMTSSTDFNGNASYYGYDTFGRLIAATQPPDSSATTEYQYFVAPSVGELSWVETRKRETAGGGTVDSRVFYDGLSRKIMTRSEGESPGQVVVGDTVQFNARKMPWKQYLPYFQNGTLEFAAPAYDQPYIEHR